MPAQFVPAGPVWMNPQEGLGMVVGVDNYGVAWGFEGVCSPMMIRSRAKGTWLTWASARLVNGPSMAVYKRTKHSVVGHL